jgi:PAS domain S-box-containing protein
MAETALRVVLIGGQPEERAALTRLVAQQTRARCVVIDAHEHGAPTGAPPDVAIVIGGSDGYAPIDPLSLPREDGRPPAIGLVGSADEGAAAVAAGLHDYILRTALDADALVLAMLRAVDAARAERQLTEALEQRVALEGALLHEQARLAGILEDLPAVVCLCDSEGHITFGNRLFRERFGGDDSKCFAALYGLDERCPWCPRDPGERQRWLAEPREALLADGRWYQLHDYPMAFLEGGDNHLKLGIDVTERRQAEEMARRDEEWLRTIVSASADAVIAVDASARVTLFSPSATRLLGWTEAEMLGEGVERLMPERMRERHREYLRSYFRTGKPDGAIGKTIELPAITRRGEELTVELTLSAGVAAGSPFALAIVRDVTDRMADEEARRLLAAAIDQVAEEIMITDRQGVIRYVNPAFERITGYSADEVMGRTPSVLKSGKQDSEFYDALWETISRGDAWSGRFINRRKDGTLFSEDAVISPVRDASGEVAHFVAVKRDVTQQIEMERQLHQSQKLEAIGELAAGIAHEINTPMQFIGDNVRFLEDSWASVASLARLVTQFLDGGEGAERDALEFLRGLRLAADEADLEYLLEEVPTAVTQTLEGVQRVNRIVRAMREFSHPGGEDKSLADLNAAVESTVTVSRNAWKYVADLVLDLDPALPPVPCVLGDVNQVVLNLITNAAHAIAETHGGSHAVTGRIVVSTRRDGPWAELRVRDNGPGIPVAIRDRVFDPFFTTKDVGKGTGQGLALAHAVIVDKHGGTIAFESELCEGTTFVVRLPLQAGPSDGSVVADGAGAVRG